MPATMIMRHVRVADNLAISVRTPSISALVAMYFMSPYIREIRSASACAAILDHPSLGLSLFYYCSSIRITVRGNLVKLFRSHIPLCSYISISQRNSTINPFARVGSPFFPRELSGYSIVLQFSSIRGRCVVWVDLCGDARLCEGGSI